MKKLLGIIILGLGLMLLNSCAGGPGDDHAFYDFVSKKMAREKGHNYHVVVFSQTGDHSFLSSQDNFADAEKNALKLCREGIFDDCYVYLRMYIAYDPNTGQYIYQEPEEEIAKKTDTAPPIIEIAEQITVNDPQYFIEGRVSDKGSDKIYVKVDNQNIPVKKGKFKIKRYSPFDEDITIVATDQWGNKATKVVKVKVKMEKPIAKLEPLNPSQIQTKTSGDTVAIIIGIENYTDTPKATYANLDAKYFFDYARKAFGVKKQNINLLIDDGATFVKTNRALSKWLVGKVRANQTDLIIFFAGHGLASSDGKELYLLTHDSDPDLLSITALSRTKMFKDIIKLKPKSVTMFLDTCYSGISRDEQMLLASARPIRIVADDEGEIPDNFIIFSASKLDQISSGLKEAKNGIFSYYLMKGLEGNADGNDDKQITNGELLAYMDVNVSQKASALGRQQNPTLAGDPNLILMKYQ